MATVSDVVAVVLAHQGGWDEVVLVILPLIVLAGLLRLARRRAVGEAEGEAALAATTAATTSAPAEATGPEASEAGPDPGPE